MVLYPKMAPSTVKIKRPLMEYWCRNKGDNAAYFSITQPYKENRLGKNAGKLRHYLRWDDDPEGINFYLLVNRLITRKKKLWRKKYRIDVGSGILLFRIIGPVWILYTISFSSASIVLFKGIAKFVPIRPDTNNERNICKRGNDDIKTIWLHKIENLYTQDTRRTLKFRRLTNRM